jgi:ribosomal protein L29
MKPFELRQKSREELHELLWANRKRLDETTMLLRQKKIKNAREKSLIKKDIARILTLLKSLEERKK